REEVVARERARGPDHAHEDRARDADDEDHAPGRHERRAERDRELHGRAREVADAVGREGVGDDDGAEEGGAGPGAPTDRGRGIERDGPRRGRSLRAAPTGETRSEPSTGGRLASTVASGPTMSPIRTSFAPSSTARMSSGR